MRGSSCTRGRRVGGTDCLVVDQPEVEVIGRRGGLVTVWDLYEDVGLLVISIGTVEVPDNVGVMVWYDGYIGG